MRLAPVPVLLAALPLALVACGGGSKLAATTEARVVSGCRVVELPAAKPDGGQTPPAHGLPAGRRYALVVTTNCGTFTIALDTRLAPHASASLVKLARQGFFDHTIFHRIVPGFVIQGGDPTQTGGGGPGYSTVDRPPSTIRYVRGVVAMAKTPEERPGTAGSQFFVVTGDDAQLPPDYAVVGKVRTGLGVVQRIGRLGDASQQPTQVVEVERVRVAVSPA